MFAHDIENFLILIQSIPSPKSEPYSHIKVGSERIDETADPELAIEYALEIYLKRLFKGMD